MTSGCFPSRPTAPSGQHACLLLSVVSVPLSWRQAHSRTSLPNELNDPGYNVVAGIYSQICPLGRACLRSQASLSATSCHASLGILPLANGMEVLEDSLLPHKNKTVTLFGYHCSTKNGNIELITPKPVKGNGSFIGHLLCARLRVRYWKENSY